MRALVALLLLLAAAPAGARDLVLVVRADSPLADIDSISVRKLFMGFTVTAGGQALHAVRMTGDHDLERAFHQSVVGMSEAQYERRLLRMAVRQGRAVPVIAASSTELVALLRDNRLAVGCLWADQVHGRDDLRVVRLLWRE
jgi:hypothetical protein